VIALTASLLALAVPSPAVTVGTVAPSVPEGRVEQVADTRTGGWLQYPTTGGYTLKRVSEAGSATPVELPGRLRGESLRISPLSGGWMVASSRSVPAGSPRYCCLETEEPEDYECCGVWAFAQRAPDGRWTKVQALPNSRGAHKALAAPVEHRHHVELAWYGSYFAEEVLVAAAPLGGTLGTIHRTPPLLRDRRTEEAEAEGRSGRIYETAAYAHKPAFILERRVYSNGTFGPPLVLRDPLLKQGGTFFAAGNGAETYLYAAGPERLMVALRPPHGTRLVHPRELLPQVTGSPERHAAQSGNGRLLIVAEVGPNGHERLQAVTVSPRGVPEPPHAIERPHAGALREYAEAIDDDGRWVVATTPWDGGPIWLHSYSPRCRYRASRELLPAARASSEPQLTLLAGPRGVFHLTWVAPGGDLKMAAVRVGCF
jgi:hypothetical protein